MLIKHDCTLPSRWVIAPPSPPLLTSPTWLIYCSRFTDSDTDSDTEDAYINENGARFEAMHKPASKENLDEGDGDYFKCKKCDVKFLNVEDGHMLGRNGENDLETHFYCDKCGVDFKDEGELEGNVVESPEHLACRDCSQKFHIMEALELHWKQVCFQSLFPHSCNVFDQLILRSGPQA